jgi:hypothetical protein
VDSIPGMPVPAFLSLRTVLPGRGGIISACSRVDKAKLYADSVGQQPTDDSGLSDTALIAVSNRIGLSRFLPNASGVRIRYIAIFKM